MNATLQPVRQIKKLTILIAICLLSWVGGKSVFAEPAAPADRSIYIFGDSWAQQMSEVGTVPPFDAAIETREFDTFITLHKHGISGSTLQSWANDEGSALTALATAIATDSSANPIVFFTLGGNDFRDGRTPIEIATDLGTILTVLEATRADIQIYYGGYDLLNPNVPPSPALCLAGMQAIFGSTDPNVVNAALYAAYQGSLAVTGAFPRTVSVDTFGSMQGSAGMPDLSMWSPVEYIADCLHPNAAGYELYIETLFEDALLADICGDSEVMVTACQGQLAVTVRTAEARQMTVVLPVLLSILVLAALTGRAMRRA